MELHILISVLSMMYSWILCTVLAVPAGRTPPTASTGTPGRHVRTKRCSCATFLDKECVYFCHLDIIWVNTPERVVSYGLGSAPRTRRSVTDLRAHSGGGGGSGSVARCQCLRPGDSTCRNFCRQDEQQPGRGTVPDALIRSAGGDGCAAPQCKQELAADTGRIKRAKSSRRRRASPPAIATKTRLLLGKWRARQRHRAREWDGGSAAS